MRFGGQSGEAGRPPPEHLAKRVLASIRQREVGILTVLRDPLAPECVLDKLVEWHTRIEVAPEVAPLSTSICGIGSS